MKNAIQVIVYGAIVVLVVSVLVFGFLAYFVTSEDKANGVIYDGLGRQLVQTPALLRFIFGQERFYPGFYWFVLDLLLTFGTFGLFGLAGHIIEWCEKKTISNDGEDDE